MNFSDFGIDLKGRTSGNAKTRCPKCGNKTSLSVNVSEGVWNCHKPSCAWSGALKAKAEHPPQDRPYVRPVWTNATSLSDNAVRYFAGRGISQQTLIGMKVTEGPAFMPQANAERNTIQFNYFRDGELVNVKYRDGAKNFKMVSGAELVFYNLDGIRGQQDIIVVEGEIDALSYVEAGFQNVVSVPNGAAIPRKGAVGSQKLEYLDNCAEYFEDAPDAKKRIFIAVDQDEAGLALKNELIRRLDVDRCMDVDLGDCKDANEFLVRHGKLALADTIRNARNFPVKGVVFASQQKADYDDLYERGLQPGAKIRLPKGTSNQGEHVDSIDDLISYEPGQMTLITGIPAHGKSYWLDFVLTRLGFLHSWRVGMFSPEHYPIKLHLARLAEKIVGKHFSGKSRMNHMEKDRALEWMNDNFFFIRPDDEAFTLENILEAAKALILRHGINALVIDPWNRVEAPETRSETNQISKQLDKITTFKQKHNVHVFLVVHPRKMQKDKNTGLYEVPTLYDCANSATFYSKTDNGMCVYRNYSTDHRGNRTDTVTVYVQKVKYMNIGKEGRCEFHFNKANGRFYPVGTAEDNASYFGLSSEMSQLEIGPRTETRIEPNQDPDRHIEPTKVGAHDECPF